MSLSRCMLIFAVLLGGYCLFIVAAASPLSLLGIICRLRVHGETRLCGGLPRWAPPAGPKATM